MINFIVTLTIMLFIPFLASAQSNDVYLQINRLMDSTKLYKGKVYKTWNGINHTIETSSFYLSEFTIYSKTDSVVLNDAIMLSTIDDKSHFIGELNIDTIKAIKFHIGVPQRLNHLDPASYPTDHPLAPQLPGMHWGWSAGYKFFVFESYCDYDDDYKMDRWANYHAVGNSLYKPITVEVTPAYQGDSVVLYLDMDHKRLYEGLDIRNELEEHGDGAYVKTILKNLTSNQVFVGGDAQMHDDPSEIREIINSDSKFVVFPNPASSHLIFSTHNRLTQIELVAVTDLAGKEVLTIANPKFGTPYDISNLEKGVYLVCFNDGKTVETKKLVVE
jgi:hypothetical protein